MNLFHQITGTVARIVRDVAVVVTEAPAVARELRQRRAAATVATVERVPAPLTEQDVKGDVVVDAATIEQAARDYESAKTSANAAARIKRAAEKILGRVIDGQYGSVIVERFESTRQVADLDQIKALFERNGLGPIPLKSCAPSLTITWAEESTVAVEAELELAHAA